MRYGIFTSEEIRLFPLQSFNSFEEAWEYMNESRIQLVHESLGIEVNDIWVFDL